jgi:hypothetical protein
MTGTFSYAGTAAAAITTARDRVRLQLGDTDSSAVLLYDEELDVYLANRANNVLQASADCAEALAGKFARAYDFETDGQTFKRGQMFRYWSDLAAKLRSRAGGITTVDSTKVDGYSDDIAFQESSYAGGTANPRQKFYVVGGLDRVP